MPDHSPPTMPPPPEKRHILLPIPTQEDVDGFIVFYRERYGVELEWGQAHEILGGLMRFLYLTGRKRPGELDKADSATGGGGNGEGYGASAG